MTTRLFANRQAPSSPAISSGNLTLAQLPVWAGLGAAAIGLVVLLGWLVDSDALRSMLPGLPTMKANTAVCFVLIGAGVALLSRAAPGSGGRLLAVALIGAATFIAAVTAAQYVAGLDLGIDQLLFRERLGEVGTVDSGRMSPLTAICCVSLGLAALTASRAPRIVLALSGVALAVSFLNILNVVIDAAVPTFLAGYTQMALNTAVATAILAMGVIGLLGSESPFVPLAGPSPTARLLRRLLAISLAVPVLMLWLTLGAQRLGIFDEKYGNSIKLLGIVAVGIIAILHSGRWAMELDRKRQVVEDERDQFFELSLDMLSLIGADGRFRRVNRAWETVLGYPPAALVGRSFLELVHPDDAARTAAEDIQQYGEGSASVGFQNRYRHHDGTYRWLEWTSRVSPDGSVAYGVARDVTDRKRAEERRASQRRVLETRNEALTERAVRDPLTGLHNRRYFDAEVARLERRWSGLPVDERAPVSIVIFDLDHFGRINKDHGHQAGDTVLRLFAGLLQTRFRETDLVARYGGEEFVAVLEGATSAEAIRIAEDVRAALEEAAVDIGTGSPIRVTVSAGCAQLGDDRNIGVGLSLADVWLSQAKRAGRNQVVGL